MLMAQITIEVPDSMAEELDAVRGRLPEVLAHGLEQLSPLPNEVYRYILEFLGGRPSAEEIVRFGPTAEMSERARALLEKNRAGELTSVERSELDEYVRIDYLITMIKSRALGAAPAR